MSYHVGDKVTCLIETRTNGYKYVTSKIPDPKSILEEHDLQIIRIHKPYEESEKYYTVLIPDDCVGWIISKFHIQYCGVAVSFLGKKFWEITEEYILRKA